MTEPPAPPPEGVLIRRAREARGISIDEAARALRDGFGARFSASRWSQLETGYRIVADAIKMERASDGRLAQMAYVVGSSPEQLADTGRAESAEVLREIQRQRTGAPDEPTTDTHGDPLADLPEDPDERLQALSDRLQRVTQAIAEEMEHLARLRRDDEDRPRSA